MRDLKTLAIAFQPPDSCTAAERDLLTVSSAKASLAWRAKQQHAQSAQKQVFLCVEGDWYNIMTTHAGKSSCVCSRLEFKPFISCLTLCTAAEAKAYSVADCGPHNS